MKWPGRRRTAPRAGWLKHVADDELQVLVGLMDLSKLGSLPPDAASLHQEIQARAELNMERSQTALALASPDSVADSADESFAEWLKFKWQRADASIRHTLRTVAEALGIDVPLTRTRRVGGTDLSPIRRSESDQHTNHGEPEPLESPAEAEEPEEPGYHDPPEWHDELADGWEPCSSLHDALHPDDRGWY